MSTKVRRVILRALTLTKLDKDIPENDTSKQAYI